MGKALLFLAFTACLYTAWATTAGTRFQLVFMENTVEAPKDDDLQVWVSNTGNIASVVTVSSPRTDCPGQTQTVPANSIRRFNVCWWMRQTARDYWPTHKTILVEASEPVMVYGFNQELYSADGFFAIPTNELSTSYYVAAYDEANIATQFAISALFDATDIKIQLPSPSNIAIDVNYKGIRYTNGETFTIQLGQYETYIAQCRGDLTGTRILSTKVIAVFSGNIRNKDNSGSRDHLVAQLPGTGNWGVNFALAPVPRSTNAGDVVRVIAKRDSTSFRVTSLDGLSTSTNSFTIQQAGGYQEFILSSMSHLEALDTNKPVEIIQMVRSQSAPKISDVADPAMFLAVSRERWLNEYISPGLTYSNSNPAVSYDKNFAFIAVNTNNRGGIRVDGSAPSVVWQDVNGISFAWVPVSGSSHRYTHTNNIDFGVMVYGASDRESYAFALGSDMTNTACEESLSIRGDGIDNDCDAQVDEEACNSVDDDGDGLIDEDCSSTSTEAFGNSYNFVFMENNVDDNPNAMSFLEVYLSAVDNTRTVNYQVVNELGTFTGSILPTQTDIFDNLPVNLRHVGNGFDTKAISITADSDVVVYGINKQTFSTDGFLAFPDDVVGTEYYTVHHYPGTDLNEFTMTPVTKTETTTVTVTLPSNEDTNGNIASSAVFDGQLYTAGQSFTFQLTYGQSAQVQGASANDNLNGARIISSLPISVFSGNVRARVDPTTSNSRDHLVQQLAPVSTWGTEFVTVPIPRLQDRGDLFYITSASPGTSVTVRVKNSDGSDLTTNVYSLAGNGKYTLIDIGSNQYAHFESNLPIQVYQFAKTTANRNTDEADPAMMLIPPVQQWSQNYKFALVRTGQTDPATNTFMPFNNFVLIAILTSQRAGLRLDGQPLSATWTEIAGSGFSATTILVPYDTFSHSLSHVDSGAYYQALMYGRGDRESYALPLGMRLIARGCTQSEQVAGDNIDNDCDGAVDEELCNSIDDDADGSVDEDCGSGDSSGTAFYVTYMDNVVEYPRDFDLELYVAVVGQNPATVAVRAPTVSFPSYDMMTEIQPGKVRGFGFTWRMRNVGQGVTSNTVYVSSNAEVVVYGINKELFSNDGFLVYPESSLGTEYYTCSWSPSTLNTEFAVVSTSDNTRVDITLPSNRADIAVEANGAVFGSGQSFSITLNRYEVYQAQSAGDLTGTRISSTIRTAVFSGNVRTLVERSASRDHLVEQMLPVSSYGTQFYIVPFPERTIGDVLKIVARFAGTTVNVNGVSIGTINTAGGSLLYDLSSSSRIELTSNNAIMVLHFVKSQDGRDNPELADPAMTIVPAVNNFISSATFITPVYSGGRTSSMDYTNFMTVVIQNGQQGNLRLNGNALVGQTWNSIAQSNYVTSTFLVPSGQSHTLTTTSSALFSGRLYGRADRESYAFPVGFRFQ